MKDQPVKVTRKKLSVRVPLADYRIQQLGIELANKTKAREDMDERFTAFKKEWKERLDFLDTEIHDLSLVVSDGGTFQTVKCRIEVDFTLREKRTYIEESGELVSVDPIDAETDAQEDLDL